MIHYNDMTDTQRLEYLNERLLHGKATSTRLDDNFVRECTDSLNKEDRSVFVKYMDIEISKATYPIDCTDEQARQPEYTEKFFFLYATADVQTKARILWHVAARYEL